MLTQGWETDDERRRDQQSQPKDEMMIWDIANVNYNPYCRRQASIMDNFSEKILKRNEVIMPLGQHSKCTGWIEFHHPNLYSANLYTLYIIHKNRIRKVKLR